ncbi:hypothetical protein ACS0TY_004832 [Phlomoides rotata]
MVHCSNHKSQITKNSQITLALLIWYLFGGKELLSGKLLHTGSAKASAPTERTETTSRVIIDMTTKNQGTLPSLHVDIAPPNTVRNEPEPVIPTQESGITTVRWYAPPRPPVQGPSMHQQLGMSLRQPSQTILQRVQLRGPAPFSDGHFTMKSKDTVQSETFNRIYVDDVGNKFMELSSGSSGNGYNKGKKKVT